MFLCRGLRTKLAFLKQTNKQTNKLNSLKITPTTVLTDIPGGSDGKASVYDAGDPGSIPGLGRSLGEGNGNPLQYYCLENPMDRGAW